MEYYIAKHYEGKLPVCATKFMHFDYYNDSFVDPFFGAIENGIFRGYVPERTTRKEFEKITSLENVVFDDIWEWIVFIGDSEGTIVSEKIFGIVRNGKIRFSVRNNNDHLPSALVSSLLGIPVSFPVYEIEVTDENLSVKGENLFIKTKRRLLGAALQVHEKIIRECRRAYIVIKNEAITIHRGPVKLKITFEKLSSVLEFVENIKKECPEVVFYGEPMIDNASGESALITKDGSVLAYDNEWRTPCEVYRKLKSSLKNLENVVILGGDVVAVYGNGYTCHGDSFTVNSGIDGVLEDIIEITKFSGPAPEMAQKFVKSLLF